MRKLTRLIAIILVVSCSTLAQTQTNKPSKAEQQILALNRKWTDSMVNGNVAALERLFDDDLIVTAGNGKVRGKAGELEDVKPTPDLKTYFFNTDDVRVRVYGDAAVVTGHAKWRINYKGKDIDNERRYMSVYAKRNGRWRMVALQMTRFPQQQPQPSQ
jgi:ketosteroid isomerase-like protein